MGAEAKLKQLGITLPAQSTPVANYVPSVRVGNLLFLSGHGPFRDGKATTRGKLGKELSVEDGYKVAREVGLNLLASAHTSLGSLDKVKRVVKVLGMVASAEGFTDQPKVINGFSDLMVEVFGDAGRHARSAVGMAELPRASPTSPRSSTASPTSWWKSSATPVATPARPWEWPSCRWGSPSRSR